MPEPPDKRRAQSYGKLPVPPPTSQPPGEQVYQLLRRIAAQLDEHDSTLRGHDQDIVELRIALAEYRTAALEVREMRGDVQRLTRAVESGLREDLATARDLGQLRLELLQQAQQEGTTAGGHAGAVRGTLGGGLAALLVGVLYFLGHLLVTAASTGH